MDELTLLNCPFCGSANVSAGEVLTSSGVNGGVNAVTQSQCLECGATGPEAELDEGEIDYGSVKSIAAWNRRASGDERERCARICETLAQMMLAGAGEGYPGNRLWQAARNIRSGDAVPSWYDPAIKEPQSDESANAARRASTVSATARVPLSEEQIDKIAHEQDDDGWLVNQLTNLEWRYFARDIERAHGITKEPK